jgi:hypothetical protein
LLVKSKDSHVHSEVTQLIVQYDEYSIAIIAEAVIQILADLSNEIAAPEGGFAVLH